MDRACALLSGLVGGAVLGCLLFDAFGCCGSLGALVGAGIGVWAGWPRKK